MEVVTRRALLHGNELGTPSVGGRASLNSLLAETDFTMASFLLSVLGEGSFLSLLAFLDEHAADPITRQVTRLAWVDEARHVAFGMAHLERQAHLDPALRGRLRTAIGRRHDALADTTGLNADVFDSLVVLAAGEWTPDAIARGYRGVQEMSDAMEDGRRQRLPRLGFPPDEAAELSSLHTRNFMEHQRRRPGEAAPRSAVSACGRFAAGGRHDRLAEPQHRQPRPRTPPARRDDSKFI